MTALITGRSDAPRIEPDRSADSEPDRLLADRLFREFDAPVGLLDPGATRWCARIGVGLDKFPTAGVCADFIDARTADAPVFLWRPKLDDDPIWLCLPALPVQDHRRVALIGFAATDERLSDEIWGTRCPAKAMVAWGRDVVRQYQSESLPPGVEAGLGWNERGPAATLPAALIRHSRASDLPERFQKFVAAAMRDSVAADEVAWVPQHPREPVVIAGASDGLTSEAYRQLVGAASPARPVQIVERPVESRPGATRQVIVIADDDVAGCLVVVNPRDGHRWTDARALALQPVVALIASQRAHAREYVELKDLLFGVVRSLTTAIDAKDPYTVGRSERVARIAVRLGQALGLSSGQRGDLYLMGLLHDIGNLGVDDQYLRKPGRLTTEERRIVQSHVRIGLDILSELKKLRHILPGVAHHHESPDGSGYPSGLAGEAIPLSARILAVADAFEAMCSDRPYRRGLTAAEVDDEFRNGTGSRWDTAVVQALFTCRADIERIRQRTAGERLDPAAGETAGRA